jgi:hypothetical protein
MVMLWRWGVEVQAKQTMKVVASTSICSPIKC